MVAPSHAAAAMPLPPPVPPPAESLNTVPVGLTLAPALTAPSPAPASPAILTPAPSSHPPAAQAGHARIVVRVKADVWIQLRERNGPVVFNRVLKSGETYTLPARPGLLFTTGNAIATEFLVDGTLSPGLGGAKGVRRDLNLDADALREGRLAAQLAGNPNVTRAP